MNLALAVAVANSDFLTLPRPLDDREERRLLTCVDVVPARHRRRGIVRKGSRQVKAVCAGRSRGGSDVGLVAIRGEQLGEDAIHRTVLRDPAAEPDADQPTATHPPAARLGTHIARAQEMSALLITYSLIFIICTSSFVRLSRISEISSCRGRALSATPLSW